MTTEPSDTPAAEAAVDLIARAVLYAAIDQAMLAESWGYWPELSETGWLAVIAKARQFADQLAPQTEKVPAAYQFLSGKAYHADVLLRIANEEVS